MASPVARKIAEASGQGSWIRRMFEEGVRLKSIYGAHQVCDLSIGNPNVEPPAEFHSALEDLLLERTPGLHGYMPNAGYPHVREAVAAHLSREQGVEIAGSNVVMTVGAAGGLNIALKTILDSRGRSRLHAALLRGVRPLRRQLSGGGQAGPRLRRLRPRSRRRRRGHRGANARSSYQLAEQPHGPGVSAGNPRSPGRPPEGKEPALWPDRLSALR